MPIWRVQMKIEILEPGKMTQSGSSLLKLIQNNKTPSLDLFVRESVQNSLDAKKINSKYVSVDFLTGTFESRKFAGELEGIEESLLKKYPGSGCTFLAVRDSNTVGLTGETDYSKVKNNEYGNVLKLIYEICRPQEIEGSGGSWGLGKTVYFRIGMGLVVYYSRIINENGRYESRLAASLVENEKSRDAMIPSIKGLSRNGIAWWGKPSGKENDTVPVTDEEYINDFLKIFGISPYSGNETGTTIIIPYTDEKSLLENNQVEYVSSTGDPVSPYWCSSVEKYLGIALQRWYSPRLSNPMYPFGTYLRAGVNGRGIARDDMEPVFQIVQALYNRSNMCGGDDIISTNKLECISDPVRTRGILDDPDVGTVTCVRVSRKELRMNAPFNKPDPSVYFNCEQSSGDYNRPFVLFTRKPGMVVSYETDGKWAPDGISTDKNEYIFAIFVLNSLNTIRTPHCPVSSVEEYVRKSEMADHTSWNDWSAPQFNPRLIWRMQTGVSNYISKRYRESSEEHNVKVNSTLSRMFGDLLLPPDGFGKQPGSPARPPVDPKPGKGKKFSFKVDGNRISFHDDYMEIPLILRTSGNKKIKHTAFEMLIDSESGRISLDEWTNKLRLEAPFSIERIHVFIDTLDGEKISSTLTVGKENQSVSAEGISFSMRGIQNGTATGLSISSEEERSLKAEFTAVIRLFQRDVRPAFAFEKEV